MRIFNFEYQSMHPASSFHMKKENTPTATINANGRELPLEGVLTLVGSFSLKRKSMSFKVQTGHLETSALEPRHWNWNWN